MCAIGSASSIWASPPTSRSEPVAPAQVPADSASARKASAAGDSGTGATDQHDLAPHRRIEAGDRGAQGRGLTGDGLGQHRPAGTSQHERDDRLAVVGLDGDHRLDAGRGEGLVEEAPGGRALAGGDEGDAGEPLGREPSAGRHCGAGREHREHLLVEQVIGGEAVGLDRTLAETEIAGAGPHERQHVDRPLGLGDSDGDPWVRTAERTDELDEGLDHEGREGHEVEVSGGEPRDVGDRGSGGDGIAQERRAGPRNASPAAVRRTSRPRRSNSGVPSSRSSVRTDCDRAGWLIGIAAAALVKPP